MDTVKDGKIIRCYTQDGFIPGGVKLKEMESESWGRQYCCYEDDLRIGHGRTTAGVSMDLTKAAHAGCTVF